MKNLITVLLSFAFLNLHASPQLPDYIIYKNDTLPTYHLLVEQYLQKKYPGDEKLFGLSFRNTLNKDGSVLLSCWRGYQAIYKIENDSLFLVSMIDCGSIKNFRKGESNANLSLIFNDKVKNGKVFIDWFKGDISFRLKDKSNEVVRWDGVFEAIYRFETLISIRNGKIIKEEIVENYLDDPDRINRKSNYSELSDISDVLFEKIKNYKWTRQNEFDCSETYKIRISTNGKIDQVTMHLTDNKWKDFYSRKEYKHCINSVKKSLSDLQFDIVKRKGKPITEYVFLKLWFDEDRTIEKW